MRRSAIVRIVIFSIAIFLMLGILIVGIAAGYLALNDEFMSNFSSDAIISGETEAVTQIAAEDVSEIEIDWVSGNIKIVGTDSTNQITISESLVEDKEYEMVCKREGRKLIIVFCSKKINWGVNIPFSKDLIIEVPMGWICQGVELDTASADLLISDVNINELDIDSASGKCQILQCNITDMDIDTASGDIYFEGQLGNLELDAASADCKFILLEETSSLSFEMASGNLELVLPDDQGFTCKVDTASGSFCNNYENHHKHDSYAHGDGSCRIQVQALSGNVTITPHSKYAG